MYDNFNVSEFNTNYTDLLFASYEDLQKMRHLYNSAIKGLLHRIDVLSGEFSIQNSRNPIHHVESRLKSPQSIVNKLIKKGYVVNIKNALENLNDIGGVRIVCPYIDDVYHVAEMILRQNDITLIKKQDYIKNPNFNGYRSLHLDIEVPVYYSDVTKYVVIEVQIRTVAMDFFASLEHDLRYKATKDIPNGFIEEMRKKADEIAKIDEDMQELHKKIQEI